MATGTAPQPGKPGSITWSASPGSAQGPDHRAKFVFYDIRPGSVINDHLAVVNQSTGSESFSIYATDSTGTTGQDVITWLKVGAKPKDIGTWEHFLLGSQNSPQLSVIVGGRKGILVPFTISVPSYATPGDHTGAVMVQVGVPHQTSTGHDGHPLQPDRGADRVARQGPLSPGAAGAVRLHGLR